MTKTPLVILWTVLLLSSNISNAQAPSCANIVKPLNAATNQYLSGTVLTWQPVEAANRYDVYYGTDPSLQTNSHRNTNNTSLPISNLLPNTTYYWQVRPGGPFGTATGCPIQMFTTGSAVGNNECINAIDISNGQAKNGDTRFANESMPQANCGGLSSLGGDVWYSFTISSTQTVVLTITPTSPLFDPVVFAYSGSCTAPQTIGCADVTGPDQNEVLSLQNLSAGTYFIRVYEFNPGDEGTFNISLGGNTLPITLTQLKGEQTGSKNVISWTTISEQNNKGFELERSVNGTDFNLLSFIPSKATNGNSSAFLAYSFDDAHPYSVNSFYRLKQVDNDGRYAFSNIIKVQGNRINVLTISALYPNPAKDKINITIASPGNERIDLVITDLAGKAVLQQSVAVTVGNNALTINVGKLSNGNYLVKAICANGCETAAGRFVKQ